MDNRGNQSITDSLTVTVKYFGTVASWVGKKEENLEVPAEIDASLQTVRERIKELSKGEILYTVLLNGTSIHTVDAASTKINKGDIFTVVPVVLGG